MIKYCYNSRLKNRARPVDTATIGSRILLAGTLPTLIIIKCNSNNNNNSSNAIQKLVTRRTNVPNHATTRYRSCCRLYRSIGRLAVSDNAGVPLPVHGQTRRTTAENCADYNTAEYNTVPARGTAFDGRGGGSVSGSSRSLSSCSTTTTPAGAKPSQRDNANTVRQQYTLE